MLKRFMVACIVAVMMSITGSAATHASQDGGLHVTGVICFPWWCPGEGCPFNLCL